MNIKLITIDLDGTLLNDDQTISARNRKALMDAEDAGVMVTIASGRTTPSVRAVAKAAGIRHSPFISNNGPRVQAADGTLIAEKCLAPELSREVVTRWNDLGLYFALYNDDAMFHSFRDPTKPYMYAWDSLWGFSMRHEFGMKQVLEEGIFHTHKIVCFEDDPAKLEQCRRALDGIPSIETNASGANNCEVMSEGVDKGWGVRQLAAFYGIDREEIMAFGDNSNDRSMLQAAGWSVAMQNGTDDLKRIARIIAPDCNDSGVGRIIEKYVLGRD